MKALPKDLRYLLFDLDGTLTDSAEGFSAVCSTHWNNAVHRSRMRKSCGRLSDRRCWIPFRSSAACRRHVLPLRWSSTGNGSPL